MSSRAGSWAREIEARSASRLETAAGAGAERGPTGASRRRAAEPGPVLRRTPRRPRPHRDRGGPSRPRGTKGRTMRCVRACILGGWRSPSRRRRAFSTPSPYLSSRRVPCPRGTAAQVKGGAVADLTTQPPAPRSVAVESVDERPARRCLRSTPSPARGSPPYAWPWRGGGSATVPGAGSAPAAGRRWQRRQATKGGHTAGPPRPAGPKAGPGPVQGGTRLDPALGSILGAMVFLRPSREPDNNVYAGVRGTQKVYLLGHAHRCTSRSTTHYVERSATAQGMRRTTRTRRAGAGSTRIAGGRSHPRPTAASWVGVAGRPSLTLQTCVGGTARTGDGPVVAVDG